MIMGLYKRMLSFLMKDDSLRTSLAERGVQRAQEYSWKRGYDKFKKVIFKSK